MFFSLIAAYRPVFQYFLVIEGFDKHGDQLFKVWMKANKLIYAFSSQSCTAFGQNVSCIRKNPFTWNTCGWHTQVFLGCFE